VLAIDFPNVSGACTSSQRRGNDTEAIRGEKPLKANKRNGVCRMVVESYLAEPYRAIFYPEAESMQCGMVVGLSHHCF
jgi:hypothetical protein